LSIAKMSMIHNSYRYFYTISILYLICIFILYSHNFQLFMIIDSNLTNYQSIIENQF